MKELHELTENEKEKIIKEINELPDEADVGDGNTVIKTLSEDEEYSKKVAEMTPRQIYEQNIASNFRSAMILGQLLPKLSKKNLVRLFLATVKLPEENAKLSFGGTNEDKKLAEAAFIQAQVANNTRTHIVTVNALAKSRYEKEKQASNEEQKENQDG
jgi:hypothetical protein